MPNESNQNLPSPEDKPQTRAEKPATELRRLIQAHIESYSGPLPNPALLREFDNVVPGAAERIIRMAEQQAQHRQVLEKVVVTGDSRRAFWGLWIGALVALCVLGGAVFLIHDGHDAAGAVVAGLDIVGLVSVFVYGNISRRSERLEKATLMHRDENSSQENSSQS